MLIVLPPRRLPAGRTAGGEKVLVLLGGTGGESSAASYTREEAMTPESTSSAPLPADKHCRSREPSRSSCVTGDVCFGKARGASHRGERRRHTRKIRGVRLALYLTCSWGSYQSLHAQNGNMRIENHKSSFLKERKSP